jgi:signal transduction histidine kinase
MTRPLRVLIVDDSETDAALLLRHLRRGGYEVTSARVDTAEGLRSALGGEPWDIVLCDYNMPTFDAPRALAVVEEHGQDLPVIVVSGAVGEDAAVDCMRRGAQDYVVKDRLARLLPAVERELAEAASRAERRRLAERLAKSEAALARSEKLRALGQMAAGISHDLKNILNPLALHLQLVERSVRRGLPVQDELTEMRQILGRAVETLERLRDFSRQAPESKVEMVDLDKVAREAVEIARPRNTSGNRRMCTLELELGGAPAIRGRSSDMVNAIVNLVVNAIDAMPDGGHVWVRTGAVGDRAYLEVADDGPGMPPEVEQRVFEPFFTTKGDEGTGLGLAMAFACAARHGGQLTLTTSPGKGACFRCELPSVATGAPPSPAVLETPREGPAD